MVMAKSQIEWTDETWNPVRGCSRISEGCRFCYAERMAARFSKEGQPYEGLSENTSAGPRWTRKIKLVEEALDKPLRWKKPRVVFVNSMGDLFHEDIPLDFIQRVFDVMNKASIHTFQVLTKRSQRLKELSSQLNWGQNIWMGVSVEDEKVSSRIDDLRECGANIKFLSLEPLIGPLANMNLQGVDWVIAGGESGPGCRPIKKEWVTDIRDQCLDNSIAFFFKQWGGVQKKKNGRLLDGQTWDQMPTKGIA